MSVAHFCGLAGIEESALRDPGVRFSQPVCNRIAELAYSRFGATAAIDAALLVEAGHFQLLELIARTAPSVKVGIERVCAFFPLLHESGQLWCEPLGGGRMALRWDPPRGYTVHHGYVELTFAVALLGIRRETGVATAAPDEIWFRHPAPDDCALHARVLGIEPRFAMPGDHVIFGAAMTALKLTRENPDVHRAASAAGAALLDE